MPAPPYSKIQNKTSLILTPYPPPPPFKIKPHSSSHRTRRHHPSLASPFPSNHANPNPNCMNHCRSLVRDPAARRRLAVLGECKQRAARGGHRQAAITAGCCGWPERWRSRGVRWLLAACRVTFPGPEVDAPIRWDPRPSPSRRPT
jgi:hypothetical protein